MTQPAPGDRDKSRVNSAIRQLYAGGANNRGTFTLRPSQTTTVVTHEGVNPNSHISIMPITQSAVAALSRILTPPNPKTLILTRNLTAASGNVSYTGLGFKPSLVELYCGNLANTGAGVSYGSYDGTNNTCLDISSTIGIQFYQSTICGIIRDTASPGANNQLMAGVSLDVDGFTIAWTKQGTPTDSAQITALCYPDLSTISPVGGVRVSGRTTGSFTLTHASNPAVDQTFTFSVTGGAP